MNRPAKFAGRHGRGYSADDRRAWIRSLVENLFGGRPTASPPDLAALRRPLPAGVAHDVAFARPLLAAYADAPGTPESDCAWSVFGHYRLAAIAAARAAQADPATAEFDLLAGAALRHVAESVTQTGRWLAEAFDLRLSPRVRPDPGGRELTGRLMFLDPALGSALQERRIWLGDIAGIGRRVTQSPVTFREIGSDRIPAPMGRAPVAEALSAHLEEAGRLPAGRCGSHRALHRSRRPPTRGTGRGLAERLKGTLEAFKCRGTRRHYSAREQLNVRLAIPNPAAGMVGDHASARVNRAADRNYDTGSNWDVARTDRDSECGCGAGWHPRQHDHGALARCEWPDGARGQDRGRDRRRAQQPKRAAGGVERTAG